MRLVLNMAWWALATVAIYLIYDATRGVIANGVVRALVATASVIACSVLAVAIYGGVVGYIHSRRP